MLRECPRSALHYFAILCVVTVYENLNTFHSKTNFDFTLIHIKAESSKGKGVWGLPAVKSAVTLTSVLVSMLERQGVCFFSFFYL